MKKVLFIAYFYPPLANSGTQRSLKFANYLPEFGWELVVLTVENPPEATFDSCLNDEVRLDTRIIRVPFFSRVIAYKIASIFPLQRYRETIVEGLEWRIRNIWHLPDMWAWWRPLAVRKALEIYQSEGFDLVYASGCPWSSFLIAMEVSKKTGVPYVLDYRDLWTCIDDPWNKKNDKRNEFVQKFYEKKATKYASGIISVSKPLIEKLKVILPRSSSKRFCVIPNGFDPIDYYIDVETIPNRDFIQIGYMGVWKEGYNPSDLYKAMKILQTDAPNLRNKIRLCMSGFIPGQAAYYGLGSDSVTECGRVTHKEALRLMQESDILYLPVAKGEYAISSLPGKLFEYLGSDTPILASVPKESEVAKLLNKVGCAICIEPGEISQLASVLIDISRHGFQVFPPRKQRAVKEFTRKNLTQKLARFLSQCVSR